MIRHILTCFLTLILIQTLAGQVLHGGGNLELPVPEHPCLSPEAYAEIELQLAISRANLVEQGILPEKPNTRSAGINLEWPLRQAMGFDQPDYYSTVNFVDLDNSSGIKDYTCKGRSYNGHNGLDISSWPFWWQMMDDNQVEIIAGAPGVIILKSDDYFDKNCTCVGTWNAVYVEHADGSVAWYGHMKKNSLTSKPVGSAVETGEYLGLVGSSGCSSNPHLHLEIRDAANKVIETHAGSCNTTTDSSWWAKQKPYFEPTINRLTTHAMPPELKGFCPDEQEPNLKNQFETFDFITFTAWYRDQQMNETTTFQVLDPNGIVQISWSDKSPATYAWSWWWWSYFLPVNAIEGIWTFEATYNGLTRTHPFQVGEVSAVYPIGHTNLTILSNPVHTDLTLKWEGEHKLQYTLSNFQGQECGEGVLLPGVEFVGMSMLPAGVYMLHLVDVQTGEQLHTRIIKTR